jgi:hypothetical protein
MSAGRFFQLVSYVSWQILPASKLYPPVVLSAGILYLPRNYFVLETSEMPGQLVSFAMFRMSSMLYESSWSWLYIDRILCQSTSLLCPSMRMFNVSLYEQTSKGCVQAPKCKLYTIHIAKFYTHKNTRIRNWFFSAVKKHEPKLALILYSDIDYVYSVKNS